MNPVIKINNKKENKLGHTAPYPLELVDFAVKFFSGVDDIVLDPFIGSGTTAIACINTNRNYLGFELDEGYYKASIERINNHVKDKQIDLFEIGRASCRETE